MLISAKLTIKGTKKKYSSIVTKRLLRITRSNIKLNKLLFLRYLKLEK